jgi:hypothetical protein
MIETPSSLRPNTSFLIVSRCGSFRFLGAECLQTPQYRHPRGHRSRLNALPWSPCTHPGLQHVPTSRIPNRMCHRFVRPHHRYYPDRDHDPYSGRRGPRTLSAASPIRCSRRADPGAAANTSAAATGTCSPSTFDCSIRASADAAYSGTDAPPAFSGSADPPVSYSGCKCRSATATPHAGVHVRPSSAPRSGERDRYGHWGSHSWGCVCPGHTRRQETSHRVWPRHLLRQSDKE